MNKAVLSSAVLAVLTSGSALAATVYKADGTEFKVGGRVEFRGDFIGTSKGAEIEGTMDDKTRARLNLKGKTEIQDGMSAFAVYEAEQSTGDSEFENRYMYAGVDFDGQAFSVGRQDMASVIVSDMTDITEFSGVQQAINASSDKEDSVIAYRGGFDSLQLEVTYQANSEKDADGYSLAGLYSAPMGLDIGLAYSAAEKGNLDDSQVLVGLGYTLDNLYLAGTYSKGDNEVKKGEGSEFTAYELAAQYKFTKQFSAAVLYKYQENEASDGTKADATDGVEIAGYYKFNSNFRTYVSYFINGISEVKNTDGLVTAGEDTLRLGARYDF
ncbi:porin [Vibrio scophthalmi]|uniref:porin n=1 Tax=Vibrio scophthalmi TaxID=45658 RepID=UPI002FF123C4